MPMTEADLPDEWTKWYGNFVNFGEEVVIATCRRCFALVNSDYFAAHNDHCADVSLRGML